MGVIPETIGIPVYSKCTPSVEKSAPFVDTSTYVVPAGMETDTHLAMLLLTYTPFDAIAPPNRQYTPSRSNASPRTSIVVPPRVGPPEGTSILTRGITKYLNINGLLPLVTELSLHTRLISTVPAPRDGLTHTASPACTIALTIVSPPNLQPVSCDIAVEDTPITTGVPPDEGPTEGLTLATDT